MRKILFLSCALMAMPVFGQAMYKCPAVIPGGAPVFQQKPCEQKGGEEITIKTPKPGVSEAEDDEFFEKQQRNMEVMNSLTNQSPTYQEGSLGGSTGSGRGKTVHVRSYTRRDGTQVRSYLRSSPRH